MSKRSDLLYLGHMLEAARRAHEKVAPLPRDQFDGDSDLQMLVAHLIQIVGEAARRLPDDRRLAHPEIAWTDIIGMRHKIVHDYFKIDLDILWHTATEKLPELISQLERIIPPEPPSA
jgi:uncharacterized protein with HEPN domain